LIVATFVGPRFPVPLLELEVFCEHALVPHANATTTTMLL